MIRGIDMTIKKLLLLTCLLLMPLCAFAQGKTQTYICLLYTSPSPRD